MIHGSVMTRRVSASGMQQEPAVFVEKGRPGPATGHFV
jgi:hypothetical protein